MSDRQLALKSPPNWRNLLCKCESGVFWLRYVCTLAPSIFEWRLLPPSSDFLSLSPFFSPFSSFFLSFLLAAPSRLSHHSTEDTKIHFSGIWVHGHYRHTRTHRNIMRRGRGGGAPLQLPNRNRSLSLSFVFFFFFSSSRPCSEWSAAVFS